LYGFNTLPNAAPVLFFVEADKIRLVPRFLKFFCKALSGRFKTLSQACPKDDGDIEIIENTLLTKIIPTKSADFKEKLYFKVRNLIC